MIKKKAKKKKTSKKVKKPSKKREVGKQMDPVKVRQDIAGIVKARAKQITKAVVEKASRGELAPTRYLLEMAGVYPLSTDGSIPSENEESLAATLLTKLGVPLEPVIHDMYEKGEDIVIPPRCPLPEDEEKDATSEAQKELVPAE
jgi:hypothetical protein